MTLIDQTSLMDHVDNDIEFLKDIFELFCEEYPNMQAALRSANAGGDLENLRQQGHVIKGMLANFFATAACDTASEIEELDDAANIERVAGLVELLSGQLDDVKSELEQIIANAENEND